MKHPQTIGVVERSHAALKRVLKLNTDEKWTTWYRYVELATFIHNTSYLSSIGCTPTSLFQGREPIKPIDLRFRSLTLAQKELTSDYLVDLQDSSPEKFSHAKSRLLDAYHKYRTHFDRKAAAKPLVQKEYCLLLNPSLMTQSDFAANRYQHRTLTCEIFHNITVRRIDYRGLNPLWLRLYTHRWHHQMLAFNEFNVLPHTFEWSALIDYARQYADNEELQYFADWLITVEQPQRRTLFFNVL